MKTLKNRILSGAMAGALALSLAVPAFASNSTDITGTYQAVTIDVTVPTSGTAQINPYGLDVKIKDAANSATLGTISGQQIVTQPLALQNKTAMNLSVSATVLGTVDLEKTDMKLAAATTKAQGTEGAADYVPAATVKSAFVYLQMVSEPALTGASTVVDADAIATKFAAWAPSAYDADTDVIVGTKAATKENMVTLKAAKLDANDAFDEFKAGSIALFRLAGDCVVTPKTEWKTTDEFKANIAFTFLPVAVQKYTVTIGTVTGGTVTADVASAAEGDTVTLTPAPTTAGQNPTYTITAADGTTITATGNTFTMPAQNVTVTATFA